MKGMTASRLVIVLGAVTASAAAHSGLTSDVVQAQWTFPPSHEQTSSFGVGPGIELPGNWGLGQQLDVGDDYIEARFINASGLSPGVNWTFSSLDLGGIGGVAISTNLPGWNDGWASFTTDSVNVAFVQGAQFAFGQGVIRVALLPVPESEAAALWLLGVVCLGTDGWLARRRGGAPTGGRRGAPQA